MTYQSYRDQRPLYCQQVTTWNRRVSIKELSEQQSTLSPKSYSEETKRDDEYEDIDIISSTVDPVSKNNDTNKESKNKQIIKT
jgi:hypothetical protein